jgi:tetratricopeptide (TPR) repeat protein
MRWLREESSRGWGWMVGTVLSLSVLAADGPDQVAFNAALRSFSIGAYPRAAEEFTAFSSQFPDSALRPEALRRALYAQGEAEAGRGDHAAAQKTFGLYLARFSGSELTLHAWVRRAEALFRSSQPQEAAALLDQPDGPFRQALGQGKPAELLFTGLMLAAEAHLGAGNWTRAREAVIAATPLAQKPEAQWDRLRLEVRILEAGRQVEPAIAAAEQLRRIADADGLVARRPESSALLGRLLLAAGQGVRAVAPLEENLAPAVPAVFRSDAIRNLSDWWVSQGQLSLARERLEGVITGLADDASVAALRLRLGQIHLREHLARRGADRVGSATAESNVSLTRAVTELERAALLNPPPEVRGPLTLTLAWCRWEEALAGNSKAAMAQALSGFQTALSLLPDGSPDRLVARFKAADAAAWLGDAASALTGYLEVADAVAQRPVEREAWMPAALEQAVISAIASTNAPAGESALRRLLELPQAAVRAGQSVLWLGSSLARQGAGELGRGLLQDYLLRFPESAVRPEVELELAMLGLHDERWADSVAELRRWLVAHPQHPGAVRAGFHLAYALSRSGDPAAAMSQFSELAAKNPADPGTLSAQLWLAGRFFEQQDYLQAGQASAAILTNATVRAARGDTWYRARLWAAEAGRKLQNFDSSAEHFRELINDKAAPPEIQSAALFHYGELLQSKPVEPGGDPLSRYRLALEAFTRVLEFTNSPYLAPALGMMGNCHFQLSTLNPADYTRAADLYLRAAKLSGAGIETRCRAWLGYAAVNRKMSELRSGAESAAFLERAIQAGLDVALGKVLLPGEKLSADILTEAARATGEILERLGRTGEAAGLYEHVARELPTVAVTWGQRARRIRESQLEKPR